MDHGWVSLLLLPAFLLLLTPSPGRAQSDPCAALSRKFLVIDGRAFSRPLDVLPCTESVAFDAGRDLSTLNSVKNSLKHFYAPLKLAASSPEPRLPSKYDPIAELDSLSKRKWTTAEGFYDAVGRAVRLLNDGHTHIEFGCPPFAHYLALPLVQVVEGGKNVIRVAPESMFSGVLTSALRQSLFKFGALRYAGRRVVKIQGVPAWQFLLDWVSKTPSIYHDPSQQINFALASFAWSNGTTYVNFGNFGFRNVNPRSNSVRLTVSRTSSSRGGGTTTVSVPWVSFVPAYYLSGLSSRSTYYSSFCASNTMRRSRSAAFARFTQRSDLFRSDPDVPLARGWLGYRNGKFHVSKDVLWTEDGAPKARLPKPVLMEAFSGEKEWDSLLGAGISGVASASRAQAASGATPYFPVLRLNDGKTAVVQLHTFFPQLPANSDRQFTELLNFFANEFAESLRLANSSQQIVIDVSGNGGGIADLVDWAAELVVGTTQFRKKRGVLNTPLALRVETEVVRRMIAESLGRYDFSGWFDLKGKPLTSKKQLLSPSRNLTFGADGRPGTYSNWVTFGPNSISQATGLSFPPAFAGKPFVIMSNGLCYSGCTYFSAMMKLEHGVRIATVGGIKGSSMNTGGGGGTSVVDVQTELIDTFSNSVRGLGDAPEDFRVSLSMSVSPIIAFRKDGAGVPKAGKGDFPLESQFLGGDFQLDYSTTNVNNKSLVYIEVAKVALSTK